MMRRMPVLIVVVAMSAIGGCSHTDDAAVEEATSTTTEPTTTKAVEVLLLRLTFDGESCIYEGPTVLAAGRVELVFRNESDEEAAGGLFLIATPDKTYQDVVEYQGESPSSKHAPWWASEVGLWSPIDPGEHRRWETDVWPETVYWMVCGRTSPFGAWLTPELAVEG